MVHQDEFRLAFGPTGFTPKLVTMLREGYDLLAFRKDAVAGLTVAVVALPLSIAIAIASHAPPASGLITAIVAGFLISALGGSRFQIGGPAGAFIVLVATIIDRHGLDGLLLATVMAGAIMLVAGLFRIGTIVRYVPHAVTIGFTAGIAIIILASQLREILGLSLSGSEPADFIHKLDALAHALPTFNLYAALIAVGSISLIVLLRRWNPRWPGFLIAVALASFATWAFHLDVATIGSRFGDMPNTLPMPELPAISAEKIWQLLPAAISIAILGSIESLLSAVVADSMTGRSHRSNAELVAQGIANIATPFFGGITATGTIARTATNVRAGAHGPMSGMLHAVFLLLFMLFAAPLMSRIPLAALAGILVVVAWNMIDRREFVRLRAWPTLSVVLVTLLFTVFHDLIAGIAAGILVSVAVSYLIRHGATSS